MKLDPGGKCTGVPSTALYSDLGKFAVHLSQELVFSTYLFGGRKVAYRY